MRGNGPVAAFADTDLAAAWERIRALRPQVIALETEFAASLRGRAFIDRLRALPLPDAEVHLISEAENRIAVVPLIAGSAIMAPASEIVVASSPLLNTRRTPRFAVVNVSVLGAQVISEPVLRPNQRIRVVLSEEDQTVLRLIGQVAWSAFEKPKGLPDPHYRAGLEFGDAAARALEEFCRRHCLISGEGDANITE